jgi:tetratricopeptide (TPR) repeat protein
MRFKSLLLAFASAILLTACASADAQVLQISGKVTLKQADGTVVPVQGAQVDIYRTDIKWDAKIMTNKKGEYMHAGIPFVGTYTLAVSAPGARPDYLKDVKLSGHPTNDFQLQPGDGSRLTLDQIKAANVGRPAGGGGGSAAPSESKETKAAREELERKNKEILEKNKKIEESNTTVDRTFKAGNDALNASPPRYDEAIASYQEGLATRPEEAALLINMSEAMRRRGVDRFNAALKADGDARTQGIDSAKKDWSDAATAANKAVDIINAANPAGDNVNASSYAQNKLAAVTIRAMAMRFVASKVDQSQAQAAWNAYQQLLALELDPAKKAKFRAEALQTVFDAGAIDLAVAEARKIVATEPDDVDANRVLGLALFASGDKAKFQEAANFLQHYVDKAPDTDPLKASAKESLDYLKTAENIKPEKATSRPTRTRRP